MSTRLISALVVALPACVTLSEQQISDLSRWSMVAANHCAAKGQCPDEARCVNATVAALDLTGTYSAAATTCKAYQ